MLTAIEAALLYGRRCPESMRARTSLHEYRECAMPRVLNPKKSKAVSEAAVYRFTWWDRYAGKDVVSPRSATLEAITRCNGTPIEDTGIVVSSRDVDSNGFYSTPNG
jgi:hypothetical protein